MKKDEKNSEPELDKGAIHETILSLIQNELLGLLLDAGAGRGALSLRLSKLGFQVISVDIVKNFEAKEFDSNLEFIQCDLEACLPFKSNIFDYIVSSEVIEHLENPWHFLREINRILKERGKLYLTTPNIHSIHQRIFFLLSKPFYFFYEEDFTRNKHITPILYWNLERMLKVNGFKIEKITFNRAFIPKIKIFGKNLKTPKCFLFGENIIVIATKVEVRGDYGSKSHANFKI